jgi:hypothetical protein
MAKKEIIGGIVEKSLREIIESKKLNNEEKDKILENSLKLVALAMHGYVSPSNNDDLQRARSIIEGQF